MRAEIKTQRFITCPSCSKEQFAVEHLFEIGCSTFGPWSCEECENSFRGQILPSGEIELEVLAQSSERVYSLAKFRDLYLVLDGLRFFNDNPDSRDYLFHEHQCPTNLLRKVVDVYNKGGFDPHGEIRLVAEIPVKELSGKEPSEVAATLEALFKLFKTDGEPIPSAY